MDLNSSSMTCHTRFLSANAFRSRYSSQVIAGSLRTRTVPGRSMSEPLGGMFSLPDMQSGTIGAFDSRASRKAAPWKLPMVLPAERVPSGKKMMDTPSLSSLGRLCA